MVRNLLSTAIFCCVSWPRFPEYELRAGGADITIDAGNCASYVAAVVEATLGGGVARQVHSASLARCRFTLQPGNCLPVLDTRDVGLMAAFAI